MRRKIFICFFVVLLMTTLVVPAFATTSGGSGSSYISPAVVISNVKLLDGSYSGSVVDWPNNYASSNGQSVTGHYGSVLSFDSRLNGDLFDTTLFPGSSSSIQLNIADLFWYEDLYFSVDDDGYESTIITSVHVSGNLITVNKQSGEFCTQLKPFGGRSTVNSSQYNLAKAVRDAVGNIEAYGDLVFLQNVSITIDFYASDPASPVRLHFSVSQAKYSDPFVNWFNTRHLAQKVVVEEIVGSKNLFQWLLDSVNAFLNFELIPNMSINRLFYIVMVIGVLLWFIRVFV